MATAEESQIKENAAMGPHGAAAVNVVSSSNRTVPEIKNGKI